MLTSGVNNLKNNIGGSSLRPVYYANDPLESNMIYLSNQQNPSNKRKYSNGLPIIDKPVLFGDSIAPTISQRQYSESPAASVAQTA